MLVSPNSLRSGMKKPPIRASAHKNLTIALGIASTGRPDILRRTVPLLAGQSRPPDKIIICVQKSLDIDAEIAGTMGIPLEVHFVDRGLARQRNRVLDQAADADVLVFLDDDFVADPFYVAEVERFFLTHDDAMMVTGHVLVDGIKGPGLSVDQGLRLLQSLTTGQEPDEERLSEVYNGYGCNMAFRLDVVREEAIRFDEDLALWCWLEDVDFSRMLAHHGRILASNRLRGVHLGVKAGRTSGVRFGYSQLANPYYLARKGTMLPSRAGRQVANNVAANLVRSLWPEAWVDRRGRLKGNALALLDFVRGRLAPQNILQIK